MGVKCALFGHRFKENVEMKKVDNLGVVQLVLTECKRCDYSKVVGLSVLPDQMMFEDRPGMKSYAKEYFEKMTVTENIKEM